MVSPLIFASLAAARAIACGFARPRSRKWRINRRHQWMTREGLGEGQKEHPSDACAVIARNRVARLSSTTICFMNMWPGRINQLK